MDSREEWQWLDKIITPGMDFEEREAAKAAIQSRLTALTQQHEVEVVDARIDELQQQGKHERWSFNYTNASITQERIKDLKAQRTKLYKEMEGEGDGK